MRHMHCRIHYVVYACVNACGAYMHWFCMHASTLCAPPMCLRIRASIKKSDYFGIFFKILIILVF